MRLEIESNVATLPLSQDILNHNSVEPNHTDAGRLLKQGISAAQSGERALARTLLLRVTEADPGSPDAWLWLASISEYPEELLGFLNNVLELDPANARARQWEAATRSLLAKTFVQRGITAIEEGRSDFAVQCFDKALGNDERCEMAWFWKASMAETEADRVEYLERVVAVNPDNEDAKNALGAITQGHNAAKFADAQRAAVDGDWKSAEDLVDQLLESDLSHLDAWMLRSHISPSLEQKLLAYDRILEIDPENAYAGSGHEFLTRTIDSARPQPAEDEVSADVNEFADEEYSVSAPEAVDTPEPEAFFDEQFDSQEPEVSEPEPLTAVADEPYFEPEAVNTSEPAAFFDEQVDSQEPEVSEPATLTEVADEPYSEPEAVAISRPAAFFDEQFDSRESEISEPATLTEVAAQPYFEDDASAAELESLDSEPGSSETLESARSWEDPAGFTYSEEPVKDPVHESVTDRYESAFAAPEAEENIHEYPTEESYSVPFAYSDESPAETGVDAPSAVFESDDAYVAAGSSVSDSSWAASENPEPVPAHDLNADLASYNPFESKVDEPAAVHEQARSQNHTEPEPIASGHVCPYCGGNNEPQAFACESCHAVLSMSDIESLLGDIGANREAIQNAVTRMEAEWNLRDFNETELTTLGVGHFNLKNYVRGLAYLQEASRLNPNNVILAGQVNALAIRLDEMRRQEENHESMPKGRTILVVDDSATVRKLISSKLEKCGHNVLTAVDGVEAMEVIANVVPDLVLLDIAMPRMDGYSVCKLIRSSDAVKDVPVVMISGKDGFFDKVRGRMAGTTGYITKPFGPETLMRALETYLLPDEAAAE
jgi:twitching motility two-component system response regulator PilG